MKCCLTCAFCTRNQNTLNHFTFSHKPAEWQNEQKSLNFDERAALKKGNDNFIGKEIKDRENWEEKLALAKEQVKKDNPLIYQIENSPTTMLFRDNVSEGEKYGLPPCPPAPTEDYLSCFHEQWSEVDNLSLQENRKLFLKEKKCSFYFPFKKMNDQTLTACEKYRKELQEKNRFFITTFLVILGIIITILMSS